MAQERGGSRRSAVKCTTSSCSHAHADCFLPVKRLVHLHAKDISVEHGAAKRGEVTVTPVGGVGGDGVADGKRVIETVRQPCPHDIVSSVGCGTNEQAEWSIRPRKGLVCA